MHYDNPPDIYFGKQRYHRRFSPFRAFSNLIGGGVTDTIKGIFSLKGLITMGLTGGLIAITGGGAIPFLAAAGIGLGGFQIARGARNAVGLYRMGDTEGSENAFRNIGSGMVSMALSFLGLRSAYQSGTVKTGMFQADKKFVPAKEMIPNNKGLLASAKGTFRQLFADIRGKSVVYERIGEGGRPFIPHRMMGEKGPLSLASYSVKNLKGNLPKVGLKSITGPFFSILRSCKEHFTQTAHGVLHFFLPKNGQPRFPSLQEHQGVQWLIGKNNRGELPFYGIAAKRAGNAISQAAEERERYYRYY